MLKKQRLLMFFLVVVIYLLLDIVAYQYATSLLLKNEISKVQAQKEEIASSYKMLYKQHEASTQNIFTLTAYNAEASQTDSTPNQTAIMEKPVPGWTVAVSQDLKHWLGKKVYIEGLGVRKVNDLMNKRYTKRIDVCMGTRDQSLNFGIKKNRQVVLIDGTTNQNRYHEDINWSHDMAELKYNTLSANHKRQ